ncbi:kinase-like domain-containing protein [Jimgerdemannia flammicorona]|uniref:Kinase-like domain-containing protein n=1 Tax=Jimgerdemannia flammicorona TaxID=994334 RepID=A0A433QVS7_9FUNG|nr:kinase-like domain-containing protein [Jimgerdemannia flammicorona]
MSAPAPLPVPKLEHWEDRVLILPSNPRLSYDGLDAKSPTWPSQQGGVYLCHEARGERQNVVIKKYRVIEQDDDPETFGMPTELVENEVYTMIKCAPHPNILRLHSIHILDNCVFLLVSGLVKIHEHGYIHRDIRCENVFLGKDNTIIMQKIIEQGPPNYPENLHSELVDFMDQCFIRDPEQRASAGDLLKHCLLSCAEEPLFPPRLRKQPSPLAETSIANTPQIPSPQLEELTTNAPRTHSPQPEALTDSVSQAPSPQLEALTANITPPEVLTVNIPQTPSPQPEELPANIPRTPSAQTEALTPNTPEMSSSIASDCKQLNAWSPDLDQTSLGFFSNSEASEIGASSTSSKTSTTDETSIPLMYLMSLTSGGVPIDKLAPNSGVEPNPNFYLEFGEAAGAYCHSHLC